MLHDAHLHVYDQQELESLLAMRMPLLCNVSNPEQYAFYKPYLHNPLLHLSIGVHPWHVDTISFEQLQPYMEQHSVIGEIGMDNVWCNTSLELQKQVFVKQLDYAKQKQKPVVLHTKGQEKEILDCIRQYPNTYLVHWYSCMEYLEDYIELGCYFTVGPDLKDEAVRQVIEKVPMDRLLIESDGLSAIAWAKNKDVVDLQEYKETLEMSVHAIAEQKRMGKEEVEIKLYENFCSFIEAK